MKKDLDIQGILTRGLRTVEDHLEVVIYTLEGANEDYPIVGYIKGKDITTPKQWNRKGESYTMDRSMDIEVVPPLDPLFIGFNKTKESISTLKDDKEYLFRVEVDSESLEVSINYPKGWTIKVSEGDSKEEVYKVVSSVSNAPYKAYRETTKASGGLVGSYLGVNNKSTSTGSTGGLLDSLDNVEV